MAKLKEGDRVRVSTKGIAAEERPMNSLYEHMDGLTGTVANYYNKEEIAVNIDPDTLGPVPAKVHKEAGKRMRQRFLDNISEEQRKMLTKEELGFEPNYVVLVREEDLTKI